MPRFPLLCNEDNNLEVFLGPAQGRVGEALRASSRAVFRGAGGDPPGRCHDSSCCPRALPCVHGLADLQAAGLAALPWVSCHVVVLGRAPRGLGTVVALLPVHTVGIGLLVLYAGVPGTQAPLSWGEGRGPIWRCPMTD